MKKLTLFFLLFSAINLHGQGIDTMYTYFLDESNPVERRFTALNHFTFYTIFSNPDTALYYSDMSIEFAKEEKNYRWLAHSYNTRGVLHQVTGDVMSALDAYLNGLRINEHTKDSSDLCTSYLNLGSLYVGLGDFETAQMYNDQGIAFAEALGLKSNMANGYNNAAAIAELSGNPGESIQNFKKCIPLFTETNNLMNLSNVYANIGKTFIKMELEDSARSYFDQSLKLRRELGFFSGEADIMFEFGSRELRNKNYSKARDLCLESNALAIKSGDPEVEMHSCQCLFEAYEGLNNWKEAHTYMKRYYLLRDSTKGGEVLREAIEKESAFRHEKENLADSLSDEKERSIAKAQIIARDAEIEQKETVEYSMYGGIAGLALFAFFIFNRFQASKKQNKIIAEQKEKVDVAYEELEAKNGEIMDSITYAKRIQNAILPPDRLVREALPQSFVLYQPKDIVAGDFYWLEKVSTGTSAKIVFAVGDCTGHGVPGALVSVVCHNALNRSVREFGLSDPGKILDKTRELVIEQFEKSDDDVKDGMDIALCALSGNRLQFSGAHCPLWIVRHATGELEEIKPDKQPVGKFANAAPFNTISVPLHPGDLVYLFSDGYADQFGGDKGKKFKAANFKSLLIGIHLEPMDKQKEIIHNTFKNWRGNLEQVDDVCVIGIKV